MSIMTFGLELWVYKKSNIIMENDTKIGETDYINEFIIPKSGTIPTKADIHVEKSIGQDIQTLVKQGGASVGGWNSKLEIAVLAYDSMPGGKFDIKSQEKYGGAFDGYLLNGKYVTVRSAGNYLAVANAAVAGITKEATMKTAGRLHKPIMLNRSAPYYGEIPYAGRRIEAGFDRVSTANSTTSNTILKSPRVLTTP